MGLDVGHVNAGLPPISHRMSINIRTGMLQGPMLDWESAKAFAVGRWPFGLTQPHGLSIQQNFPVHIHTHTLGGDTRVLGLPFGGVRKYMRAKVRANPAADMINNGIGWGRMA